MKKLLLAALCLLTLSGCGYNMLERQVFPLCISLDLEADGRYTVGVQASESAAAGAKPVYDLLTATGSSPEEALDLLSASTPFPLNFCQVRQCLVSYELGCQQPLRPMLAWLLNLPTMRPNAQVMITLGPAKEVLQAQQPDFGMRLSNHLNLLFERLKLEGLLPDTTLSTCTQQLADPPGDLLMCLCAVNPAVEENAKEQQDEESGDAQPAAVMGEPWNTDLLPDGAVAGILPHDSLNPVEYLGSAVVADGLVCGVLSARETQLVLLAEAQCAHQALFQEGRMILRVQTSPALAPNRQALTAALETLRLMGCDALGFAYTIPFQTNRQRQGFDFKSAFASAQFAVE